MKAFLVPTLVAGLTVAPAASARDLQPVLGEWYGSLNAGVSLPLVFHLKADGSVGVDSPAQGAKDLPGAFTLSGKAVTVTLTKPAAVFEGQLSPDGASLAGQWKQNGAALPLVLTRKAPAALNRPQTPRPPFPYRSQEVAYVNPVSKLQLAGTLTLPQGPGPFPAALLITGSGPQDRDETILGHKPFAVLADALTRKGVAVLRVDDRGVGGSQAGKPTDTSADFATDVEAGVAFLRGRPDIDPARVGLIGHSEGGLIAPLVAAKDPKIAFVVLMAGPGVDGETLILSQGRAIALASGAPAAKVDESEARNRLAFDAVRTAPDDATALARLDALLQKPGAPTDATTVAQVRSLATPWWRYFLASKPADALSQVKAPILAVGGSKDLQVPASENLAAIRAATAGNPDATVRELPGLNHLFQTTKTGLPTEYSTIEETIAPSALDLIVDWTATHAKAR
ncbi:MAG: alpha/beta fold hydrolase [Caulobacter sp.]|nr:alpha/beta fold hydrolase [Caulobacter sp.]